MQNTTSINTNRLILRKFNENDFNSLFLILKDKDVNTYLPMFPLKNIEEAKQYLYQNFIEKYKLPISYHYAICLKSNNIPIGYINISDDESFDFGYALNKNFWNNGIITETAKAIIKMLKCSKTIPFITATHDIKNIASGKVMQKIGMKYQYSYQEQWQPKDILVTFRMYQLNFDNNTKVFKKYWNKYPIHFVEKEI